MMGLPTARARGHKLSCYQRVAIHLLSARGYTVEQLADLFQTHRDTVSGWLSAWQDKGLDGLTDAPKAGRTPKIDAVIKD